MIDQPISEQDEMQLNLEDNPEYFFINNTIIVLSIVMRWFYQQMIC